MSSKKMNSWNRKKSSSYRINRFSQNENILIVCEGQTEKYYFESFDVAMLNVQCIDTKGRTKLQLVEFCEKKVDEYKKEGIIFKEIWCVFDMDVKRGQKEFADFDNAIHSAHAKGYKVAYSNDAFEVWFYLHFNYTDQQLLRTFYYGQLSNFFGYNYEVVGKTEENCKKNYNRLLTHAKSDQIAAIRNSKKLHTNQNHLPFSQQNPVTTVYLLVQKLNKHLKGVRRS